MANIKNTLIEEDNCKFYKDDEVFYNPAQKINRDITLLVLNEFLKDIENPKVLFAMEATGIRGIRFIKSNENATVIINDISLKAIKNIESNLNLNDIKYSIFSNISGFKDLKKGVFITKQNCIPLMTLNNNSFDAIDIDPYGSCSIFVEHAMIAIKNNGILSLSCTDKGSLVAFPKKCFIRYGSQIKAGFNPETSLRVLLSYISKIASKFEYSIEPLVSFTLDFFVRVIVKVIKKNPKSTLENNSLYLLCDCSNNQKLKSSYETFKCNICHNLMKVYGPYWSGKLQSKLILKAALETRDEEKEPRIVGLFRLLLQELDTPFSFNLDKIGSISKTSTLKTKVLVTTLANNGFDVSLVHYSAKFIKTNASLERILDLVKLISTDVNNLSTSIKNDYVEKLFSINYHFGLIDSKLPPGKIANNKNK